MYFHGGGWVLGDYPTHERLIRDLVNRSGAAAAYVDYTPSPEAHYPTAINQAYGATKWVAEHGREIGVDGSRLAVAGNSVGGNMAAVVALMAKDKGTPKIRYQLLLWPVTDANFDTGSYKEFAEGHFLTRALMDWFRGQYLGATEGVMLEELCGNPDVSPLHAKSLEGLPSALMLTAEFDPLRDEGLAYARRLAEAGVEVSYRCHEGLIHGFANLHDRIPASSRAIREAAVALRLALSRP